MKVEDQALTLCFPTPIWRLDFSDYQSVNTAIRDELEALGWDKLGERQRAIIHPSHTFSEDSFVTVDEVPSIQVVLEFFVSACNAIARERNWDTRETQVTLQNYWVHATPPGELTQYHDHKPGLLSGVYYVDKPENSGDLIFIDVNPYQAYGPRLLPGETDPITRPEITFKADEGTMLIFPAWLPHKVPRNSSDRRRISISFNAI
ncbi:MAG: hypothetical protein GWP69_12040 [Gammaproteobacteria bacterium]|jgi:uncharacterized protein (TIGR02466 family)|nr:hypothetical protein [Gammaproteobacteria bacterium]